MFTRDSISAALALSAILTTVGCASDSEEAFFSPAERERIHSELGVLAATPPADPSNAYGDDPAAAELGRRLFFDTRYSGDGAVSCATCHAPEQGFQDARGTPTSEGLQTQFTGRHAPTVINAAYGAATPDTPVWQFWDGRRDSLWSQALGPPESPVEMGSQRARVVHLVVTEYLNEYEAVFGPIPEASAFAANLSDWVNGPTAPVGPSAARVDAVYANFGKAIAAYERLIVSRNSRFDAFYADLAKGAVDSDHLSDSEKRGLRVFLGAGACADCHGGANFTDGMFHNLGVAQQGDAVPEMDAGRFDGIPGVLADPFNCAGAYSDHPDKAACAVATLADANDDEDTLGAFKTPSLRSISQTAPYMHTGHLGSLEEVVAFYNRGGDAVAAGHLKDERIRPLGLTDAQSTDLVAFMRALDGEPLPAHLLHGDPR